MKKPRFIPLHDRVLVKRDDTTASGLIVIPDSAQEKPLDAVVIAVGPGKRDVNHERIPMPFRVGDKVLLGYGAGVEIRIDGELYLCMREDEIFAVTERKEYVN